MVNQQFKVTISAEDKATAVVRRVNAAFSKMTEPFARVGETLETFNKGTGLEKITDSFGELARSAGEAATRVAGVATPIGVLSGAASVGGVMAFAEAWGEAGTKLQHAARGIGITTDALQQLQGAAVMSGLSREDATGALAGMARSINDYSAGRNPGMAALLAAGGIDAQAFARKGHLDQVRDLADAVASKSSNPQAQETLANGAGVGGLLPLLREGSKGIDENIERLKALGAVQSKDSVEKAEALHRSLAELGLAFQGVTNRIGDDVAAMKPMIDGTTELIRNHQELATRVTEVGTALLGLATAWGVAKVAVKGIMLLTGVGAGTGAAQGAAAGAGAAVAGNSLRATVMGGGTAAAGVGMSALAVPVLGALALGHLTMKAEGLAQSYAAHNAEVDALSDASVGFVQQLVAANQSRTLGPDEPSGILLQEKRSEATEPVTIDLNFNNVPPGMRLDAKAPPGVRLNTQIGYSMPTQVSP